MSTPAPGILAIWSGCAPGREADFERWYRTEHLAERVGVPGFRAGWRYVAVDAVPRYLVVYETDSADVLFSPAYRDRLNDPTALTRTIMEEVFVDVVRTECERIARLGDIRGAFAVTARYAGAPDAGELHDALRTLAAPDAVVRAEAWTAAAPERREGFAEQSIRGPDAAIGACLVLETLAEDEAHAAAAAARARAGAAAEVGVYRFLCAMLSEGPDH